MCGREEQMSEYLDRETVCKEMRMVDLKNAWEYFQKQYHTMSDYFGCEKFPDEISAIRLAIELIEEKINNGGDTHG